MRILLSAVACNPERGSEAHFGWNAVRALSREHDLTVIAHGNDRAALERAQSDGRLPRTVRFYYARECPRWHRNRILSRLQSWRDYGLWCRESLAIGRRLHAETPFDLVHHITLSTWRIATPLWKLGIPLVWGPIGGAETFPLRLYPTLSLSSMAYEALRSLLNLAGRFSPSVRACARNASALIASNPDTAKLLEALKAEKEQKTEIAGRRSGDRSQEIEDRRQKSGVSISAFQRFSFSTPLLLSAAFFTEDQIAALRSQLSALPPSLPFVSPCGLPAAGSPAHSHAPVVSFQPSASPPPAKDQKTKNKEPAPSVSLQVSTFNFQLSAFLPSPLLFFAGGDIEGRKGIALALRALAIIKQRGIPFHYHVGGTGPETGYLQRLAMRLGISDSVTLGVPLRGESYRKALQETHIYLLPSLRDNAPVTLMEAMLAGCVPVVADCGGPGAIVTEGCGYRIPVTTAARMVAAIADALQELCNDPALLQRTGMAASNHIAENFSETNYLDQISEIYGRVAG